MSNSTQPNVVTIILLIIGAVLLVSLFSGGGGVMGAGGMMGGWMFLWPLLLIGGLVWFLGSFQDETNPRGQDTALEALRNQYARGEISEEEFENRRRKLRLKE